MSQAGIRPKNHPKQVRARSMPLFGDSGALDDVDDRRTPRKLFERWNEEFRFTVDAAANADNALLPKFWSIADNALGLSWEGERVWCNPPYSDLAPWVAKALHQTRLDCPLVVMLLPADRTEQPFWQDYIEPNRDRPDSRVETRFLRKRIKFGLPPGHPDADKGLANGKTGGGYRYPPFGCVLVIFRGSR
jgi:phage N-6-adenine-methyltransferase